jgi:hypothetical protein
MVRSSAIETGTAENILIAIIYMDIVSNKKKQVKITHWKYVSEFVS